MAKGQAMGMEVLGSALKELDDPKEKVHEFHFQTDQGVAATKVPHSKMKACHCGCDRFEMQYHVGWGKPLLLGAPPIFLRVEIYVCATCGLAMSMDNPSVGDMKAKKLVT